MHGLGLCRYRLLSTAGGRLLGIFLIRFFKWESIGPGIWRETRPPGLGIVTGPLQEGAPPWDGCRLQASPSWEWGAGWLLFGAGTSSLLLPFSKPPLCGFAGWGATEVPISCVSRGAQSGVQRALWFLHLPREPCRHHLGLAAALLGLMSLPEGVLVHLNFGCRWPTEVVAVGTLGTGAGLGVQFRT